jgi:hypothetical protein
VSRAARATVSFLFAAVLVVGISATLSSASCGIDIDSGQIGCSELGECPPDFECRFDGQCYRLGIGLSRSCGNGMVELNETCDPRETCPDDCDDGDACTVDTSVGSEQNCNVACLRTIVDECVSGDGCCPTDCGPDNDSDCSDTCGNGELEAGETCDPPETCPTECEDNNACTLQQRIGSRRNCNVRCVTQVINKCESGDGCCPGPCDATNDSDCSSTCGNNIQEPGETCDPPSSCPQDVNDCDDDITCTNDEISGSAANCSAECVNEPIPGCEGDCDLDNVCDFPDERPGECPDCFGCGDEHCDFIGGERPDNCPEDCDPCGDGVCDPPGETSDNCEEDCSCGDMICDPFEFASGNCPPDCGQVYMDGGVSTDDDGGGSTPTGSN